MLKLFCNVLTFINQAFLGAFSNHDDAVTLLLDAFHDVFIKAIRSCQLKWQFWD